MANCANDGLDLLQSVFRPCDTVSNNSGVHIYIVVISALCNDYWLCTVSKEVNNRVLLQHLQTVGLVPAFGVAIY